MKKTCIHFFKTKLKQKADLDETNCIDNRFIEK